MTYLCFSRYLRIERERTDQFVNTARALLDAGASANTGWYEMIDHPNPRKILESALYGAAGIAQNPQLTKLLLDFGADPNDEETPYHLPEGYDNTVMQIVVESGRCSGESLTTMLLRKCDWHDKEGVRLLLEHGANPNAMTRWGYTAFHQALRRDNELESIVLLLDHGADPTLKNENDGRSGTSTAAYRGRGEVLALLDQRGIPLDLEGVDALIAACAKGEDAAIAALAKDEVKLAEELVAKGGALLAEFAGNGNSDGVRCLLDLGVQVDSRYRHGDGYFDIAPNSTALHVAAWRARPATVKLLIQRGAAVNAFDGKNRTPLSLAIKACVDSFWKHRRTTESIEDLLKAGASTTGIELPCGYREADVMLVQYRNRNQ